MIKLSSNGANKVAFKRAIKLTERQVNPFSYYSTLQCPPPPPFKKIAKAILCVSYREHINVSRHRANVCSGLCPIIIIIAPDVFLSLEKNCSHTQLDIDFN